MPDVAAVTVIVRGLVAALLAVGGGCCLYFGFKLLFVRRPTESKSTLEATIGQHKIAFSAGAAGTAVVFVSTVWVAGSIMALPNFSQTGKDITVTAIPFQGSAAALAPAQKEIIDALGPTFTAGSAPLVVEGYANTGNETMNQALAQRRAEEVKKYLIHAYKLPEGRVSIMAHGENGPPMAPGANSVVIRSGRIDG